MYNRVTFCTAGDSFCGYKVITCVHDFVAIHLVVITADNLNACIHFLYFCSFSHVNQGSMLREYKDGLRKAILRNSMLLGCLLQDSLIICSCY